MNILLVTNLFPTPVEPERGIFTLQLVKRLINKASVTVVCPLPWFPKWEVLERFSKWYSFSQVPYHYQIDGVEVYSPKYLMLPKVSAAHQAFLMKLGLAPCLKKLSQQEHFDVINSHWFYPDGVAVDKLMKTINIPHIPTGLGCDVNRDIVDPEKREQVLVMLRNSAAITVVSEDLKRVLVRERFAEQKITVTPNGVDTEQFKLLDKALCRAQLGLDPEQSFVLYVGRLSEEKNVARLLQAFAQLDHPSNPKLYLVGDGPLRNELGALAESLRIADRLIFVGKVEHKEVSLWMGSCDYFCLPSLREGCPNVILEALGSGRPVVGSRVGAIPDVVDDNSGVLFDPQNIDSIVGAFNQAFAHSWQPQLISQCVKSLSWENAADNYLKVFHSVTDCWTHRPA